MENNSFMFHLLMFILGLVIGGLLYVGLITYSSSDNQCNRPEQLRKYQEEGE